MGDKSPKAKQKSQKQGAAAKAQKKAASEKANAPQADGLLKKSR